MSDRLRQIEARCREKIAAQEEGFGVIGLKFDRLIEIGHALFNTFANYGLAEG